MPVEKTLMNMSECKRKRDISSKQKRIPPENKGRDWVVIYKEIKRPRIAGNC